MGKTFSSVFYLVMGVSFATIRCKYASWVVPSGPCCLWTCEYTTQSKETLAGQELRSSVDTRPFLVQLQFLIDIRGYLDTWMGQHPLISLLTAEKLCHCPNLSLNGEN